VDVTIVIPILTGWLGGWLVNYLSDVLPHTRRLSRPTCQHCQTSFTTSVYLRFAKCEHCGHSRSWRTFTAQGLIFATIIYIWFLPPLKIGFWLGALLILFFWLVTIIDLEHRLILHPVSIFGIGLGLLVGIVRRGFLDTLFGGLAGLGIMLTLYLLGMAFAKIRAKRLGVDDGEEALGFGDVALSTVLGLVLGWPLIWFGLLLGILISGAFILLFLAGLFVTGKYKTLAIFVPYGPYLVASTTLLVFFPQVVFWISA